ncbi:unnamed protein product [Umbelopsis ramanniana]
MQQMPYYPPGYQAPSPYASSHLMQADNGLPQLSHPVGVSEPNTPSPGTAHPAKRKQVKNACTNCQKACKKCDEARPCPRCVKYGIATTCVNSTRKERKKGVKRGPYKRRQKGDGEASTPESRTPRRKNSPEQPQYDPQNIRASMPFGYPNGLNQYGQPYDAYGQYASQQYMVSPVYPGMSYPVQQMVPGADGHGQNQQAGQHQYATHSAMPHAQQHSPYNGYQGSPHQQSRPLQQVHPDVKDEQKPHQPLTPVPSTSSSSAASSPHINVAGAGANVSNGQGGDNDEEGSRLARLSQLCRAALDQSDGPNATEST